MKTRNFILVVSLMFFAAASPLYALEEQDSRLKTSLKKPAVRSKITTPGTSKISPASKKTNTGRRKTSLAPMKKEVFTPQQIAANFELIGLSVSPLSSQCLFPFQYTIKNNNTTKILGSGIWLKFWHKGNTGGWDSYYSMPISIFNANEQKSFPASLEFESDRKHLRVTLHYPKTSLPISEVSRPLPNVPDVQVNIINAQFGTTHYTVNVKNNSSTQACKMLLQCFKATAEQPNTWLASGGRAFNVAAKGTQQVQSSLPSGDQYKLFKFLVRRNNKTYAEKIFDTRPISVQQELKMNAPKINIGQ